MNTKEEEPDYFETKEYFEAMDKYYKDLDDKWDKAKEELEGLIDPKYFDFAMSNETYYSEGIVEIEEYTPRNSHYKDKKHCKVKGESEVYIFCTTDIECYDFESKYEGEEVEYYVWQQTGYLGDDYSGYLLLPLLDGKRFWKVSYSC